MTNGPSEILPDVFFLKPFLYMAFQFLCGRGNDDKLSRKQDGSYRDLYPKPRDEDFFRRDRELPDKALLLQGFTLQCIQTR